jgi:hypothetical protein
MGALVDGFGGKISGELIRASEWNGLLAGIEALVTGVQQAVELRLAPLEAATADLGARVTSLEGQLVDLTNVAATLRARQRRLSLLAGASRFAIGQRGEITAAITSFDGAPLALADAATRPWVDFVTAWGTLLPVPGFVSRSGSGGRSVSVQVDSSGQARVLLQADHAFNFSEAEHVQVQAAMATRVVSSGQEMSVADAILAGPTPASVSVQPAFRAVTQAYSNAGTNTVQRYLDAYYLVAPSRVAPAIGPIASSTWTDYLATVFAFVKPDADPVSPDGAMASGSIQVTFRDWVTHWVAVDFFADLSEPVRQYREVIPGLIRNDLRAAVDDVLGEIDGRARGGGVLGGQRQYEAASSALRGLNVNSPVTFFADAVDAVVDGIAVQRAVSFGQAVTPGGESGSAAARAVASSAVKATGEAARVGSQLTQQFTSALDAATKSLRNEVQVEQQVFRAELLRDDGPISIAQKEARDVRGALESVNRALGSKAEVQFVTDFVKGRG